MLNHILFHYLNMGTFQFLRDFRLAYKISKTMELRKKVTQRKEKRQEKNDSVPFQVMNKWLHTVKPPLKEPVSFDFTEAEVHGS